MTDQIEAADRLLIALADREVASDLSVRDLIEAMDETGIVFAPGNQREAIAQMDREDAE